MKIYVLKKIPQRKYDSDLLLQNVLLTEGQEGFEIKREENGKPYLLSPNETEALFISVSHTKQYWACSLSQSGDVGIDIEERSRSVRKNTAKMLHPLEQEYLSLFLAESREWTEEFLNIWTRKESYIKCLGSGLSEGLSSFSVVDKKNEYALSIKDKNENTLFIKNVFIKSNLTASVCAKENFEEPTVLDFYDEGSPLKPALEQAADFLSIRDYSTQGLIKKLKEKGHSSEAALVAAKELTERGYIDDIGFSQAFVRSAMQKGKGKQRTEKELIEKGIDKLMAREIILEMADQDGQSESERAFFQAKKIVEIFAHEENQVERPPLSEKQVGKVARRLSTLGYEGSVIYETINRLRR